MVIVQGALATQKVPQNVMQDGDAVQFNTACVGRAMGVLSFGQPTICAVTAGVGIDPFKLVVPRVHMWDSCSSGSEQRSYKISGSAMMKVVRMNPKVFARKA